MDRKIVRDIHIVSNKLCRKSDQVMNKYGCTHSQNAVMFYIIKNQDRDIYQKDIEEAFGIRRSSVSAILTHLEKKGFIARTSVEKDGRLKKISLTNEGRKMVEDTVKLIHDFEESLLSDISEDELDTFYNVLYKLAYAVDKSQEDIK